MPSVTCVQASPAEQMQELMQLVGGMHSAHEPKVVAPEVWRRVLIMFLVRLKAKRMRSTLEETMSAKTVELIWKVLARLPLQSEADKAALRAADPKVVEMAVPGLREAVERIFHLIRLHDDGQAEYADRLGDYLAAAFVPLVQPYMPAVPEPMSDVGHMDPSSCMRMSAASSSSGGLNPFSSANHVFSAPGPCDGQGSSVFQGRVEDFAEACRRGPCQGRGPCPPRAGGQWPQPPPAGLHGDWSPQAALAPNLRMAACPPQASEVRPLRGPEPGCQAPGALPAGYSPDSLLLGLSRRSALSRAEAAGWQAPGVWQDDPPGPWDGGPPAQDRRPGGQCFREDAASPASDGSYFAAGFGARGGHGPYGLQG